MDSDDLAAKILAYLKAHPFVPLSLLLSLGALLFGAVSLTSTPYLSPLSIESTPETTSIPGLKIAVDVEGEVAKPGLVELEAGSGHDPRVADALKAAGGLLPTADSEYVEKNINLAALVQDGMKLYVPKIGENSVPTGTTAGTNSQININTAPEAILLTLKGVGKSRADAIIQNRPYSSLEELKTKAKLPASLLEGIKDEITF